jgi:hypothetical protein
MHRAPWAIAAVVVWIACAGVARPGFAQQTTTPSGEYHIYAGSTHAHTVFTWSHGEQWEDAKPDAGEAKAGVVRTPEGAQLPPPSKQLKADWQQRQGPPGEHYARAKAAGYDFYTTTDHSQEADLQPPRPDNPKWQATKQQAEAATETQFVALAGFEYSENNGPGGVGHINVINTADYLNALAPGVDLPTLYKWLKTAKPNGEGPVVASFNHPGTRQYNDWDYRDAEVTDVITMLEVINSNNKIHYDAFVRALDKGWKVSPVCGNDNHGFYGIGHQTSRTFVLASDRSKPAILDAMKHRRTYASLERNLRCRYTVNGAIMGSTLDRPARLQFDISVSDPDSNRPEDKITRIDIVRDNGEVAAEQVPPVADYSVHWRPTLEDSKSTYFFVRVWNAGGGDAPKGEAKKPVAWLAPVWTGR